MSHFRILPNAHAVVTEFIAFSNVPAARRTSGDLVIYAFSMHLVSWLDMAVAPKLVSDMTVGREATER
jgi:hypothetical protein